jgi:hypothetical protein
VVLPLAVVGFFLAASAIPRWTVPPPQFDLLVKAGHYPHVPPSMHVDFVVTGDGVQAQLRSVPAHGYPQQTRLYLVDHATGQLREVPVRLPEGLTADDLPRDVPVESLAGRRVLTSAEAPDGYRFDTRTRRSPGVLGDLFGMRRYDAGIVLVNRGRVVPLSPPAGREYLSPVTPLGWIVPDGR